ncbi:hypothetical protein LTR09_011107 [Extremus antarcticus]|uniref:Tetratricopeptide SHNi-TPR domain-containing protein n=1 Tax=Extremus antarcticus TaxID=702011 RepID=A0AAJ0DCH0_9PEZI|nr:hypothetical protein LTR09_011107 [Extremus antarcticus]
MTFQPHDAASTSDTQVTIDFADKISKLKDRATQQYSLKHYPAAAELYSEAAEIQDQLNGEMNPDNADLLYQYGKCLYHVAVSNSDVLGGKVASSEEPKRKKRKTGKKTANGEGGSKAVIGEAMKSAEQDGEQVKEEVKTEDAETTPSKPFFQITGDENFTDDEDEADEDAAADAEAEEEEDDFAIAYEILDVARVLFERKIDQLNTEPWTTPEQQRQIHERLADTHDLQAEINLENERFTDAIKDTRDALALKMALYPEESSLRAEAHYKLSLALEFASVTSTVDEPASVEGAAIAQVDETMRAEAASEMELAIASCNARIAKETIHLISLELAKQAEQARSIADVKEMVVEMQQRLLDLQNPAVSLSGMNATGMEGDGADAVKGMLGELLGENAAGRKKKIEEATAGANDLSGMVKRKKKPVEFAAVAPSVGDAMLEGNGKAKRKAEEVDDEGVNGNGKKVKFEEEDA